MPQVVGLESDPLISLLNANGAPARVRVGDHRGVDAAVAGGFAVTIHNPTAGVEVAGLLGYTAEMLTTKLHAVGLVPNITGSFDVNAHVVSQSPLADDIVLSRTTVTVTMKSLAQPALAPGTTVRPA